MNDITLEDLAALREWQMHNMDGDSDGYDEAKFMMVAIFAALVYWGSDRPFSLLVEVREHPEHWPQLRTKILEELIRPILVGKGVTAAGVACAPCPTPGNPRTCPRHNGTASLTATS